MLPSDGFGVTTIQLGKATSTLALKFGYAVQVLFPQGANTRKDSFPQTIRNSTGVTMVALGSEVWITLVTFAVLAVTVVFFISGKYRSDVIALCALLALMFFGVLTPGEALSGFSNSLILTLAGVFVVGGAIVRSGLASAISAKILGIAGNNQNLLFMLLMLITAAIGSLVSNTGTVAIMMPIVVSMALSIDISPSRFLMPLAFMSSIGGMMTLIGNPGNMVVNDVYVKAGNDPLTLFSFLPVGLVSLVFGMLVLAPATSFFLARRKNEKGEIKDKGISLKDLANKYHLAQNSYKIFVPNSSPMIGQSLGNLRLTAKYGVVIQDIRRFIQPHGRFVSSSRHKQIAPGRDTVIQGDDILYCMGTLEHVESLVSEYQLELMSMLAAEMGQDKYIFESMGICELVLMSSSSLVKRTIEETSLREHFGISVLGIQRGNQNILDDLKDQVLQSGDSLLVQGPWENLARLDEYSENWVVVGRPQELAVQAGRKNRIVYVSVVLLLMIVSMATGIFPTVLAVLLAALAIGLGGVYRNVEEVYSAINWETIVMIACMLPMAIAMEKSGIAGAASETITELGRIYGPWIALAVVYGITSVLNIVISATPVALLVAQVGIQVALGLEVSPLPFVYAVAVASCMCFASPFSTPSNALVMSAGRYTFLDYLKIGLPLQALMGILMVLVLPYLFPF